MKLTFSLVFSSVIDNFQIVFPRTGSKARYERRENYLMYYYLKPKTKSKTN